MGPDSELENDVNDGEGLVEGASSEDVMKGVNSGRSYLQLWVQQPSCKKCDCPISPLRWMMDRKYPVFLITDIVMI